MRPLCYESRLYKKAFFSLQMMYCGLSLLILFTQEGTQCTEDYENALSAASCKRHPSQLFPFLTPYTPAARMCVCVIARRTKTPP